MNVLFIINTPGGSHSENTIALVPSEKLEGVNLDLIDGKMVNAEYDDWDENQTITLYKRFGLEKQKPWSEEGIAHFKSKMPHWTPPSMIPVDLEEFLNPSTPFVVDKVVHIGWVI